MRRIPALTDCQLKKGCYQPAHKETIQWRTGWRNGFVTEWKKKPDNCADECFKSASEDGWKKGKEAGERDVNHECPAYPHPRGKAKSTPSDFRVAWRLGWYKAYHQGETVPGGYGYRIGMCDARRIIEQRRLTEGATCQRSARP